MPRTPRPRGEQQRQQRQQQLSSSLVEITPAHAPGIPAHEHEHDAPIPASLLTRLRERDVLLVEMQRENLLLKQTLESVHLELTTLRAIAGNGGKLAQLTQENEKLIARWEARNRTAVAYTSSHDNASRSTTPAKKTPAKTTTKAKRRVKRVDAVLATIEDSRDDNLLRHAMLTWTRCVLHKCAAAQAKKKRDLTEASSAAMERGARLGRARAAIAMSRWLAGRAGRALQRARDGYGAAALCRWRMAAASAKLERRRRREDKALRIRTAQPSSPPPSSPSPTSQAPRGGKRSWLAPPSPLGEQRKNSPKGAKDGQLRREGSLDMEDVISLVGHLGGARRRSTSRKGGGASMSIPNFS